MKIQRLGGYSAIAAICLVVLLLAIVLPFSRSHGLNEQGAGLDPEKVMAAYSSSPAVWSFASIMEILIAILGLLVVLGLHERMHNKAPNLMRLAVIAVSATCILSITNVLINLRVLSLMKEVTDLSIYKPLLMFGNGIEVAMNNFSGWVALLIGIAAISTKALPRFIAYVFFIIGILGVIRFLLPTTTPGATGITIIIVILLFYVIAYIWLGIVMIRDSRDSPPKPVEA